jgi:hypothetical protein
MDTLRGSFDNGEPVDDSAGWDADEHDAPRDLPPAGIGQDERRMQVRAYNHWAALLGERSFPSIEDLEPHNLPDFGPNSVLLDFSAGIEDPIVLFLGDRLGRECGSDSTINRLSDVPPRSLLSRITDHYMQILANQAPIGFEAEFVNQRGSSILYRGILLPFSSDDETIDFIFGVINWKEMADQVTSDELLLEIDQALDNSDSDEAVAAPLKHHADPLTEWADSPAHDLPLPDFGEYALDDPDDEEEDESEGAGYSFASLTDYIEAPAKKALDLESAQFDPAEYRVDYGAQPDAEGDAGAGKVFGEYEPEGPGDCAASLPKNADLYDCLASARQLAESARTTEDRSRQALYAAVGRAFDFALAAQDEPEEYAALIAQSGLTVQERAPMTPVVKLVFGADYDKTRLTEYAAVLSHAHRIGLARGTLAEFLGEAEGGLKGVVNAERRLRREESGKQVESEAALRQALARKLRALEALTLDALAQDGPEFALVMVRRTGAGTVEVIGEIPEDITLIERAARKLVG